MLRQDPTSISSEAKGSDSKSGSSEGGLAGGQSDRVGSVDIQRELNRLEEMILDSPRLPLSRRTLIDEDQLLEQLDLIRLNLPDAFREAEDIARHKEEIFVQAEKYAQEIIKSAERRAAQILDEVGIVQQAELEARQIRQRVQQECEAAREQMATELERMERQTQQEIQDMKRQAIAEQEEIQAGADEYADGILSALEQQFNDMLRVIRNGRQQLHTETTSTPRSKESHPTSAQARSNSPSPPKKS